MKSEAKLNRRPGKAQNILKVYPRLKRVMIVLSVIVVIGLVITLVITVGVKIFTSGSSAARETAVSAKRPVIIWSKWKEVILTDEWAESYETPTKRDRIVPPRGGRVEVLFENGAYYCLKGDQTDNQYRAIEIRGDGTFKLKGPMGQKAEIWIGMLVQQPAT